MRKREIKFKIWDGKHFLTGQELDNIVISNDGEILILESNELCLAGDEYQLRQFTGLKDKNGREIYEGDICNIRRYEHLDKTKKWIVAEVIWGCEHGWNFRSYYGKDFIGTRFTEVDEIEVIGNIFENKELLK